MRPVNSLEAIEERSRIFMEKLREDKEPLNPQELEDVVLWINDLARWMLWQKRLNSALDRFI